MPRESVRLTSRRRLARRAWRRLRSAPPALLVALGVAVCVFLWLAANALVQVARKPTELFSPVGGALDKTPSETWHSYEPMFRNHATAIISPIVLAESLDMRKVFRASRWGRSLRGAESRSPAADGPACGADDGEGDYLNCPLTEQEYARFHEAVTTAESATVHDLDKEKFFEGCLPIEVMAHRGRDTLRFGPMKPVGLVDPRTGRPPYAVVQLRQDNIAGDHFSLVGFQTQLKWGEQARVLRMIPGLEQAEFVRFGMVHRNTYINGPTVLRETWQTRARPDLFFAGQISGVEGYVESAASGLLAGRNAAAVLRGDEPSVPPRTTAIGALAYYVSHADPRNYQPTNITFGIMPPPDPAPHGRRLKKEDRKTATSARALAALDGWIMQSAVGSR